MTLSKARLVIFFSITRRHITEVDLYLASNFSNAEGTSYGMVYNYMILYVMGNKEIFSVPHDTS